jgi:hypothetical protein
MKGSYFTGSVNGLSTKTDPVKKQTNFKTKTSTSYFGGRRSPHRFKKGHKLQTFSSGQQETPKMTKRHEVPPPWEI